MPPPEDVFREYATLHGILGSAIGSWVILLRSQEVKKTRRLERMLSPYIVAAQTAPKIALAPLIVIWLGFRIASKFFLVALIVFFPIFVNMITGVRSVDRNLLELMRSTGASKFDIFWKIEIPGSLPMLFAGYKTGITLAVIGAVVGEFVGANAGLGYLYCWTYGYHAGVRCYHPAHTPRHFFICPYIIH